MNELADEGSSTGSRHERVVFNLEKHVESVGCGGREESAACEVQESQGGT